MSERYRALRGTHDILPGEIARWEFLERTARDVLARYRFLEIRTPLLEATRLFVRTVGAGSDIVRKEMYTFERGEDSMSLRPEGTAPVVRAVVEHALHREIARGYPERYFYLGPMFRHERPQKGRQRQFHQIGAEVLGAPEPAADVETIGLVDLLLDELGIVDRELVLGSVGDRTCREPYTEQLTAWLAPRLPSLCEDCQRRAVESPLRVLDCKVEHDRTILAAAPTLLDALCAPCAEHFADVRAGLDAAGVRYRVDPRVVRGLDYYRRTVFEVLVGRLGAQNAILGGGRYDGLVEELGGPAVPGFGFAMGMERAVMLLDEARIECSRPDAILVPLSAAALAATTALAARLRRAGLRVLAPLVERPLGAQLKRAERDGARFAVFLGDEEIARGVLGVKDLASGVQETLDEAALVSRVRGGR
jgi:histidyl-tRNA synthetase